MCTRMYGTVEERELKSEKSMGVEFMGRQELVGKERKLDRLIFWGAWNDQITL